jgi:hypothetical protein
MPTSLRLLWVFAFVCLIDTAAPASAQVFESVGERAMGMGGAFVAVATDGTATWWNPAAQATGPFLDVAIGRAVTEAKGQLPARRDRTSWFTVDTPPLGFGYYRFRATQALRPTAGQPASRQGEGAGVPYRSLSASQIGVTVGQSLFAGVHAGATLKYVRGTLRSGIADSSEAAGELLDRGDDLEGGDTQGRLDLDVGVIAVEGPIRVGAVVRNVRQPEFEKAGEAPFRLPRQVRVGGAFDAEALGSIPLVIAIDADLKRYSVATGDRRVIAVGAEQWFGTRRFGVRAGGRFNTVGQQDRAATAGLSVSVRSGLYLEAHAVRGGSVDDRGWGAAARVSF